MNYRLTTPALYVTLHRKTLDTSLLKVSKNIMSTLGKGRNDWLKFTSPNAARAIWPMHHYPKWLSWIHLCIISSFQHQMGELYLVRRNAFSRLHDFYFSRRVSVDHNNLWLGFSSPRENVFKINSFASPICDCGVDSESVKHCSLYCPKYAAQRNVLLTSAASNMRHGLRAAMQEN